MCTLKLFDIIVITEQYDKYVSKIAEELYRGISNYSETTPTSAFIVRNNTDAKKPWSAEEREVAERITAVDIKLYNAALNLMDARRTTIQH